MNGSDEVGAQDRRKLLHAHRGDIKQMWVLVGTEMGFHPLHLPLVWPMVAPQEGIPLPSRLHAKESE